MPERKGTAPLTAREEPTTTHRSCVGCDAWDDFTCCNASSQFFGESFFVVGAVFQAQLRAYLDVAPRMVYVVLRFAFTLLLLALEVPWWVLFLAWVGAYAVADPRTTSPR